MINNKKLHTTKEWWSQYEGIKTIYEMESILPISHEMILRYVKRFSLKLREENFMEYLNRNYIITTSENNCWNINMTKDKDGYYRTDIMNKKNVYLHRASYEYFFGTIEKGLIVRHTCDNPSCFNPEHLLIGTVKDNIDDKINRNRQPKGESHGLSKLKEEDVYYIKFLSNESRQKLSEKYKVSIATIKGIQLNRNWKHVTKI